MPDVHALLGPSGAERWMACPPSARLSEGIEDAGSTYAREGTLAHRIGELLLRERWEGADATAGLEAARADPLYSREMGECMEDYAAFVEERMAEARSRCADPRIFIEQMVRFDEYVPEGFGTSDAIILSDGLMDVVDLKYGKGVPVSAVGNPQMRIYALGCWLELSWAYEIDRIRMNIFQPRLDSVSTDTITRDELLAWAETELKPRAALAWEGRGEFRPGEAACRWCRASPRCRAHRDYQLETAREDFADPPLLSKDRATAPSRGRARLNSAQALDAPVAESVEEVAEILTRLPALTAYAERVREYALDAALNRGERFPGFKVVAGRSNRRYADEDGIAAALYTAGFLTEDIYKPRELLGLTAMEKMVGRKRFEKLAGQYIIKPEGAPTLVPEADKRPPINTAARAAEDFSDDLMEEN